MTTSSVENIIESVLSGKTSSVNPSQVYGMEGSRFPKQKVMEVLEEIIGSTGKFTMKGNESFGNWSERINTKNLSDEDLKEVLIKLLAMKEGYGAQPSHFNTTFVGSPFHALHQQSSFLGPYSFNKVQSMNITELKQFIRMWIKQITVELVTKEFPSLISSYSGPQEPPMLVDKLFVKKVLIKFIDMIEYNCDKFADRQIVTDALRQVDVFEVIEQTVHECKVLTKVYGSCHYPHKQHGEDMTELIVTLIKEILRRREGFSGFQGLFQRIGRGGDPFTDYQTRRIVSQLVEALLNEEGYDSFSYRRGGMYGPSNFGRSPYGYANKEERVVELLKDLVGRKNTWGMHNSPAYAPQHYEGLGGRWPNVHGDEMFPARDSRLDSLLHDISPIQSSRMFGPRQFSQRSWESANPKVESLIEMLKYL